ncbi:sugar phosphate isomerase/epimerase family protein [Aquipuribacter nitratireducens]|uniref:Sugar phosphate isomerase/epimerase family protein n=1 Tax=Aquipuribacter nitratireducens TaxID=650104 RepID=A0ABW0GS69_9MICO
MTITLVLERTSVSTYTTLWREDVGAFCQAVAEAGFTSIEVLAAPPEVDLEDVAAASGRLNRAVRSTGLTVTSVVPSGVDVNLASVQAGVRAWSREQFRRTAHLAALLGAPAMVVHPGRRHPLRPPPVDVLVGHVRDGLTDVVDVARREGVQVLLENVPTGLLDTGAECLALTDDVEGLGLVYDVANGHMVEDVGVALRLLGRRLQLVHLSDTRRDRWLHDPVGSGDVPWGAVLAALDDVGYGGPLVLETLHEQPGATGFLRDLEHLSHPSARARA